MVRRYIKYTPGKGSELVFEQGGDHEYTESDLASLRSHVHSLQSQNQQLERLFDEERQLTEEHRSEAENQIEDLQYEIDSLKDELYLAQLSPNERALEYQRREHRRLVWQELERERRKKINDEDMKFLEEDLEFKQKLAAIREANSNREPQIKPFYKFLRVLIGLSIVAYCMFVVSVFV